MIPAGRKPFVGPYLSGMGVPSGLRSGSDCGLLGKGRAMKTGRDSSLHAVLVAVAFILPLAGVARADTPVGGLISTDTHWTAAGTPYTAGADIMIANNATLTIDPGVGVRFAPDTEFKVTFGKVVARGTGMSPIRFTIDSDEPATYWRGIVFERDTVDASFDAEGNYIHGSILLKLTGLGFVAGE
jgi:hypothetical protein